MKKWGIISIAFIFFLFSNVLINCEVKACKDIIACGDATDGDFNLLMKIRDPSRPGPQTLCIVPEGYEYTYHNPWTGKPISFTNENKYIGVVSNGDTIPNIVKTGMSLSSAGISYGDSDTGSNWINPTKYAWDDFDWIRYACEKAKTEDEAVNLMTKDAVSKMHATGVSENLFIVGPKKGFVIEADAYHYKVREIENGVEVIHNYPKELWKSQIRNKLTIAWSFDTVVEKYVRNKEVIRLKSLRGVKVVEIGKDYVSLKPVGLLYAVKTKNLGVTTKIFIGERGDVADFSVELNEIKDNKAKLRVCVKQKAWEEKMMEYIEPKYGHITEKDMINWSRLHSNDLDGLRSMCDIYYSDYEAVAVYKIPQKNYEEMSIGWFSPNHACSSIYVPFHICNTDIYEAYKTEKAAELGLGLLNYYGHGVLNKSFEKTEEVFFNEINFVEEISKTLIKNDGNYSDFLTINDMGMQKQAYITEQIWMELSKIENHDKKRFVINIIDKIWYKNYSLTLRNLKNGIENISVQNEYSSIKDKLIDIAIDISKTRIDAAKSIGKNVVISEIELNRAKNFLEKDNYGDGFNNLCKAYEYSNKLINGKDIDDFSSNENNDEKLNIIFVFSIILFIFSILLLSVPARKILK